MWLVFILSVGANKAADISVGPIDVLNTVEIKTAQPWEIAWHNEKGTSVDLILRTLRGNKR